jgi:acetyl-CoA C-acetyltransferase
VAHAAAAIAAGKCNVALITLAGRPRSEGSSGTVPRNYGGQIPDSPFEAPYGLVTINGYAMAAMRHMHEYGTTAEQLAWVKVAASHHAQHNPNAMLRDLVTVEDVVGSPLISDPLHRLDCCVVSDGGGALVLVRPEIARSLNRPLVKVIGCGEAVKGQQGGRLDLTSTAGAWSGARAFEEAGVKPADIQYASIYDSFTITVMLQLEDLGFCARGKSGAFVSDGKLISGVGRMPVNTDGGGLCNNHPANRGGMTKVIEAVRQLRG